MDFETGERQFNLSWYRLASLLVVAMVYGLSILIQPRVYRLDRWGTVLETRWGELDFKHPPGVYTVWRQAGDTNVRLWSPL